MLLQVQPEDLDRLSPEQAVDFFRRLLWAEATTLGIGKNLINVPSAIYMRDGGVDAEIREAPAMAGQGIIKAGLTRYQIKTGKFDVRELFFKDKSEELLDRVKACFDQGGTFVAALFGWDNPDQTDEEAVTKCRDALRKSYPQYAETAKLEIWRQNQLCGYFSHFQTLAAEITGRDRWQFQTHGNWAHNEDMQPALKLGASQTKFLEELRSVLRSNNDAIHARVCGVAGEGKTRLTLEATRTEDLAPLVAYYRGAGVLRQDGLLIELQREDSSLPVILIVDDCDAEDATELWNILRRTGPRTKLISLYQDFEPSSGTTKYFETGRLPDTELGLILQDYGLAKPDADRWALECDGNPRVAHLVGQNLKEDPDGDILRNVDTVRVWHRFTAGSDSITSERAQDRVRVLRHLALFKRFGFGRHFLDEAKAMHQLIAQNHPISWGEFQEIVTELRHRKILQGENTLYISPTPLQIRLLADFWENYGASVNIETFVAGLSDHLREWFYEMFEYAAASPTGKRIVRELLGPAGPFAGHEYLKTRLGASFFFALTKADPESALRRLEQTLGTWDFDTLRAFGEGRRDIVHALECMAIWKPLFGRASILLLALAEAENERFANNASGVFADLFSLGPKRTAPTEAPPLDRLPVLEQALRSNSKEQRALALRACDKALEFGTFSRTSGAEYQGYRKSPELWQPRTYGEWWDAYRRVWQMLEARLPTLPGDEQTQAADILIGRSLELSQIESLSAMVYDTLRNLARMSSLDKKRLLETAVETLHFHGNALDVADRHFWEELANELTGDSFHSRLRRFVGLENWYEHPGEDSPARDAIVALAEEIVQDRTLLSSEIEWLLSADSANGYTFGHEIGLRDANWEVWPTLRHALATAGNAVSVHMPSGYLRAMWERDRDRWETLMEEMAHDPPVRAMIPDLATRSGELDDRIAGLILDLTEQGIVPLERLNILTFGGVIRKVSEQMLEKWTRFLLAKNSLVATSLALDLFYNYYPRGAEHLRTPRDLAEQLLLHPSLLTPWSREVRHGMLEYHWTEIAKEYLRLYPSEIVTLAKSLVASFSKTGMLDSSLARRNQILEIVEEALRRFPQEIWNTVKEYLEPKRNSRAFQISRWLRRGALRLVPEKELWSWVDQDSENRAGFLATFVPKDLFVTDGETSLCREVLVRYGDRKNVQSGLMSNFWNDVWQGPGSEHYEERKAQLLALRVRENNPNVRLWIDQYVDALDRQIEHEQIAEERFA